MKIENKKFILFKKLGIFAFCVCLKIEKNEKKFARIKIKKEKIITNRQYKNKKEDVKSRACAQHINIHVSSELQREI